MTQLCHSLSVFELSASPDGQLLSFEPETELASSMLALSQADLRCQVQGADLVVWNDALYLLFLGAEPFCSTWSHSAKITYLCAFHPDFIDGGIAMTLLWDESPLPTRAF
jgi:hypothetical protein